MENDLLVWIRLRSAFWNLNPDERPFRRPRIIEVRSVDFLNPICIPQFKLVLTASLARNLHSELVSGRRPRLGKNTQALALAPERRQGRIQAKAEIICHENPEKAFSLLDWKTHDNVLVFLARLNAKGDWLEVQVDLLHFGPQAYRGAKFDSAFIGSRGSTDLQDDTAERSWVGDRFSLLLVQHQRAVAEAEVLDAELCPIRRRMWRESKSVRCRVRGKPKHAAEQRADYHCGGPDLVRRTCR